MNFVRLGLPKRVVESPKFYWVDSIVPVLKKVGLERLYTDYEKFDAIKSVICTLFLGKTDV